MSDSQSQVSEPIYSDLAQSDPAFSEIVELFVDGLTQRLDAMQDALQANDMDRLRRLVHQLKGSGGGHGYPVLSQNASELEQQVLQGVTGEITQGLDELAGLVARIKVLP